MINIMFFKYDGFILNMVIISNMDTQHNIWYLPSESNHVMSTNGKVIHLLIIMLITVPLATTAGTLFTLFPYSFLKLKIVKKTFVFLILAILICYLNLQHFKKHKILDQVSTKSTARSHQGSDKYTCASWKANVLESATPRLCAI